MKKSDFFLHFSQFKGFFYVVYYVISDEIQINNLLISDKIQTNNRRKIATFLEYIQIF